MTVSLNKILTREKYENYLKIGCATIGLVITVIVVCVKHADLEIVDKILPIAFSTLITALSLEDATQSKASLIEALQSQINDTTPDELKPKFLKLLFKTLEKQSLIGL